MLLIIGLGNPGKEYFKTRHNIGFDFVSFIASEEGAEFKNKKALLAEVAEFQLNGSKVVLARPVTFMNLSGESVSRLKKYFKPNSSEIIIIHDEIDLPFGTVKFKKGGRSAGHHGIESIEKAIGSDFWRCRLGIRNQQKFSELSVFVLKKFSKDEQAEIGDIYEKTYKYLKTSLREGLSNITLR